MTRGLVLIFLAIVLGAFLAIKFTTLPTGQIMFITEGSGFFARGKAVSSLLYYGLWCGSLILGLLGIGNILKDFKKSPDKN
jgi:putative Mn2+ efflux pump MntP